jgi:hypothetical protein
MPLNCQPSGRLKDGWFDEHVARSVVCRQSAMSHLADDIFRLGSNKPTPVAQASIVG